MNIGVMTAYPEAIGFNYGLLQFCLQLQASGCGLNPVLLAMTRHPVRENPLVLEARRLGIQVEILHEEFRYDPRVLPALLKVIDRLDLKLLDAQTYKPLACCLIARSLRPKVALVSWVHGFTQENLKIRLFGALERKLHRFSDRVISVSNPFARLLEGSGMDPGRIRIVDNAIADQEPGGATAEQLLREAGWEQEGFTVGAIGRLSPEKGHSNLIKAWRVIVAAVPWARLVIVGDGPCMPKLQAEVQDLGLSGSVHFAGFRPDGRRFFRIFDLMILPSLAEGLPYVLLEAMIQGVPVVATAVGEVPAVLEAGRLGRLVPPGDPQAIAENVIGLINEPVERARLAEEARSAVLSRYSPEARARTIVDIYRQALEARG